MKDWTGTERDLRVTSSNELSIGLYRLDSKRLIMIFHIFLQNIAELNIKVIVNFCFNPYVWITRSAFANLSPMAVIFTLTLSPIFPPLTNITNP